MDMDWGVKSDRVNGAQQKNWRDSVSNEACDFNISQPKYWFFLVIEFLQPNSQLSHPAQYIDVFTATGSFWVKFLEGLFFIIIIFNCLA